MICVPKLYYNPHILLWTRNNTSYLCSRLSPGSLAAHRRFCLELLHSWPDSVHRFLLRKTQTSMLLTKGCMLFQSPRQDITPTVADCGYRAPLTPRLCGNMKQFQTF